MGIVTSLEDHRQARRRRLSASAGAPPRATLFFDLGSPYTYLAAERADRLFARLEWLPAAADVLQGPALSEEGRRAVADRAALLGLPFVWPEEAPASVRGAMRVAALAAESGRGAAFVLAAEEHPADAQRAPPSDRRPAISPARRPAARVNARVH